MSPTPFTIDIPETVLDDLRERLVRTRWRDEPFAGEWELGVDPAYLRTLAEYWLDGFDWRAQEAALNRFTHRRVDVDGLGVHFVHERGHGESPLPLILTHGWPDSFVRYLKVIPMLTDPERHGGRAEDAFDVVVPSLPGYGFSDKPRKPGFTFHVGDLWHALMTDVLGYERFAAAGGDWGSTVTEHLARSHARSLVGIHLTDVPFWHLFQPPKDASHGEQRFLKKTEAWMKKEGAYALVQGTRPGTLARGLKDSPTGLAAWIVDKFHAWSDCGGDLENRFTKDELLTNVMVYWVTDTIESSFLPYRDFTSAGAMTWIAESIKRWVGSADVPAGLARFPKDISDPPREWAERFFNVQSWTEMPRGGHFAPMEEPELFVEDVRAFFRPLRESSHVGRASQGASSPR